MREHFKHYKHIEDIIAIVSKTTNINPLEKTRKREHCDAKTVIVKLMKDEYNMGWSSISRYFISRGTPIGTHASIINLYNRFLEVITYNPLLENCYNKILHTKITKSEVENLVLRIRKIEDKNKFSIIEKCILSLEMNE